jgi:3',5'-cyclic-AMP phosphodiesterase
MATLAHLSDLHLGTSVSAARTLEHAVAALADTGLVIVTGDLTENGRAAELAAFEHLTAPLADRLIVVPGNHDRCGDDIGAQLMKGVRVDVQVRAGCAIVRIDSTAPHNRIAWLSHGRMCQQVLQQVDDALDSVPSGLMTVVALHHHVVPLPAEGFWEQVSEVLRLPNHSELALGTELLKALRSRCDLVLHGHRHVPRQFIVDEDGPRPLRVFNAGSTTSLGAFRTFDFADGRLRGDPQWLQVSAGPRPSPQVWQAPVAALQLA